MTAHAPAIAVVLASTRPGRKGEDVARWVLDQASTRSDATFELVDLADVALPALDEPVPPAAGRYSQAHTRAWAETVSRFDGYVFVTPEYNHGYPGSLKNALDRVYAEWNTKSAGFVSYGIDGGTRAVEQLRQVVATLKIADVGPQVALSMRDDFVGFAEFAPREHHSGVLTTVLDDVISWARALQTVREVQVLATS
jgi:NAD(P)H-dependent FMN reductase